MDIEETLPPQDFATLVPDKTDETPQGKVKFVVENAYPRANPKLEYIPHPLIKGEGRYVLTVPASFSTSFLATLNPSLADPKPNAYPLCAWKMPAALFKQMCGLAPDAKLSQLPHLTTDVLRAKRVSGHLNTQVVAVNPKDNTVELWVSALTKPNSTFPKPEDAKQVDITELESAKRHIIIPEKRMHDALQIKIPSLGK